MKDSKPTNSHSARTGSPLPPSFLKAAKKTSKAAKKATEKATKKGWVPVGVPIWVPVWVPVVQPNWSQERGRRDEASAVEITKPKP